MRTDCLVALNDGSVGVSVHQLEAEGIRVGTADEVLVMQFTGLKDKNGKEIYEGDILCVLEDVVADTIDGYNRYEQEGDFMEVVFDEYGRWSIKGNSMVIGELLHDMLSDAEIIGNIYENPDFITNP